MGMQATSKGNMPVVLLKEGGSETKGRDAQKNNIAASKIIAEIEAVNNMLKKSFPIGNFFFKK